jgi:hypothetical protein
MKAYNFLFQGNPLAIADKHLRLTNVANKRNALSIATCFSWWISAALAKARRKK